MEKDNGRNVLIDLFYNSLLSFASRELASLILRNYRGSLIEDDLVSAVI